MDECDFIKDLPIHLHYLYSYRNSWPHAHVYTFSIYVIEMISNCMAIQMFVFGIAWMCSVPLAV